MVITIFDRTGIPSESNSFAILDAGTLMLWSSPKCRMISRNEANLVRKIVILDPPNVFEREGAKEANPVSQSCKTVFVIHKTRTCMKKSQVKFGTVNKNDLESPNCTNEANRRLT
jgi:hypothetical protein